jgi:hypothetical protein
MFKKILVSLIVLGLVIVGITYVYFDAAIRRGIEIAGTSALGTAVTVSSASLSPLTGSGTVRGLTVANVEGYDAPYAIALESIDFQVSLLSLFTDVIEITSIEVTNARVNYETKVVTDNIRELLDKLPSATAAPVVEASPDAAPAGKRVIIRELVVRRPQITLYSQVARAPVSVPDLRMRNIGEEQEGATVPEAARAMLAALNSALLFEGIPDMRTLLDSTGQQIREGASAVGDAVGGAVQSLGSGLRGLLDREPDDADNAAGSAPR